MASMGTGFGRASGLNEFHLMDQGNEVKGLER